MEEGLFNVEFGLFWVEFVIFNVAAQLRYLLIFKGIKASGNFLRAYYIAIKELY